MFWFRQISSINRNPKVHVNNVQLLMLTSKWMVFTEHRVKWAEVISFVWNVVKMLLHWLVGRCSCDLKCTTIIGYADLAYRWRWAHRQDTQMVINKWMNPLIVSHYENTSSFYRILYLNANQCWYHQIKAANTATSVDRYSDILFKAFLIDNNLWNMTQNTFIHNESTM